MALEDFEKELAAEKAQRKEPKKRHRSRSPQRSEKHSKHRHHHRHHHRSSKHGEDDDRERRSRHDHKRSRTEDRHENQSGGDEKRIYTTHSESGGEETPHLGLGSAAPPPVDEVLDSRIQNNEDAVGRRRDAWMQAPAAIDMEYVESRRKEPKPHRVRATMDEPRIELKDGLQEGAEASNIEAEKQAANEANYKFGDAGSHWRMTKLRGVYQTAKQTGRSEDEVAIERFGDLRSFDDAREEEIELDRRDRYGKEYVGKEKPNGELYQERKLAQGIHSPARPHSPSSDDDDNDDKRQHPQGTRVLESDPPHETVPLDQTALNKLKAQMMKAKLRNASDAASLEATYNAAVSSAASQRQPDVVVLNKMEARMLAGGRGTEVKHLTNKRGRERGLVEENEDMTIADMVRQERRTKPSAGAEANRALADRIAQDSSFANDLDYIDENSGKLSRLDAKSESKLRSAAIASHRRTLDALAHCPLCHHDDAPPPHDMPQAPVVSLATRVFLTLPTPPEINQRHGLCATLVPRQHRRNLLECDDDEWEELRNFMKSLARFYNAQTPPLSPVFYENAARADGRRHASMECVPLPRALAEQAPAFFRESILAHDEEWTQHRKIIDTLAKAEEQGLGKLAFRRSMVPDLPYFHVWFKIDGGLGHVVEDANRWPKGDLFARETLGGMLDVAPEVVRKQGRWRRGDAEMQERVTKFRGLQRGNKGWDEWDWTKMLIEEQQ